MPDIGPSELIIVLVIVLVLFGGKKLPDLARSLGQAKREFEKATEKEDAGSKSAKAASAAGPSAPDATPPSIDTTAIDAPIDTTGTVDAAND